MNHPSLLRLIPGLVLLLAACAGQTHTGEAWRCAPQSSSCATVFVVYDAWHAAIVVPKADLPIAGFPELADFPRARHIEFSWGDQDYFPDPSSGVFMALKAAFWSSGSVLHLVGFDQEVQRFYPTARVVELRLAQPAYERLTAFVSASFKRAGAEQSAPARRGLYTYSRFYPSTLEFSLLNTCNTWVARALQAAGLPVTPGGVITAGQLGDQLGAIAAPAGAS